jgi:hypothetical protein
MCNRTDVRNGPALLLWLCLCDDSFLGREVVGFIHGQLFRCSRLGRLIHGHRALMFPPETIPLPDACVGLFFAFGVGGRRLSSIDPDLETTKPSSRVFGRRL